jgi:hypothetical protein
MYIFLPVKYRLFLSDYNETDFLNRFSKNTQILNLIKIRPVGTEFFDAERRAGMKMLIVAFRNFLRTQI